MEFITSVFYLFILNIFFSNFFKRRQSNTIVAICIWLMFYLIHYCVLSIFHNPFANLIISYLLLVLVCKILYLGSLKKIFAICLLGQASGMMMEICISFFLLYLNYDRLGMASIGSVVSKLVILFLLHAVSIYKNQQNRQEPSMFYWILLIITSVSSILIAHTLYQTPIMPENLKILSALALLAMNASLYIIYNKISRATELLLQNQIMQQQIHHYNDMITNQKHQDQYLKRERHDLKNQLITLRGYAAHNKNDEIIQYINRLLNEQQYGLSTKAICNNLLINTLLSSKLSLNSDKRIAYTLDINVPDTLPFDEVDLSILIGNALDNAWESSTDSVIEKPFIDITIQYSANCLYCHFSNPFVHSLQPASGGLFNSTKSSSNHGYGLQSIQNVVDKYDGSMEITTEDHIFSLKIILYVT